MRKAKLLMSDEQEREVNQVVKMLEDGKTPDEILFSLYKVLTPEMEKTRNSDSTYWRRYGERASDAECNYARRISKTKYIKSLLAAIEY